MELKEYFDTERGLMSATARNTGISRQLLHWHVKNNRPWAPEKGRAIQRAIDETVSVDIKISVKL